MMYYQDELITVWTSTCGDCHFVTGIAIVKLPNGITKMLTGAGCFAKPRRNPKVALAWAQEQLNVQEPESNEVSPDLHA